MKMKKHEIEPLPMDAGTVQVLRNTPMDFNFIADQSKWLQVQRLTEEFIINRQEAGKRLFELGRILNEIRNEIEHGEWLTWLERYWGASERSAQQVMMIYRNLNTKRVSDLDLPMRVLNFVASDSTPEPAKEEILAKAEAGEKVTLDTAKEIKEKHAPANRNTRNKAPRSKPSDDTIDGEEIIERDHDDDDQPLTDVCEELVAGKNHGIIKGTKWGWELWARFHPDWDRDKILHEMKMAYTYLHCITAHHLKKHCSSWEEGADLCIAELEVAHECLLRDKDW
jgi:hypothetical protein